MSIASYIRVSSLTQSFEAQRDAIVRALPSSSVDSVHWYSEKKSAKSMDRPVLHQLLSDIRVGQVSTLYLFKLDRLCRSGVADTFRVVEQIRRAGTTLHAVADNLTIRPGSDDITSEVLIFALGLAARLERAAINDRIAAAKVRVEAEGKKWGRPSRLSSIDIERIRRMRGEGKSVRYISQALGIPRAVVGRAVQTSRLDSQVQVRDTGELSSQDSAQDAVQTSRLDSQVQVRDTGELSSQDSAQDAGNTLHDVILTPEDDSANSSDWPPI